MLVVEKELSLQRAAFTLAEMLVVISGVCLLLVLALVFSKRRIIPLSKTQQCKANLSQIAKGFSMYELESDGKLPYSYIRYNNRKHTTWDTLLAPYIRSSLGSAHGQKGSAAMPVNVMRCPSDTLSCIDWAAASNLHRRSYSMSEHDMQAGNWPPGPQNTTGMGLWWNFGANGELRPDPAIYNYENTNRQQSIRVSMLLVPSSIMLLGEQISSNNIAQLSTQATIATTAGHLDTNAIRLASFQTGRFNYLMVDGAVQFLTPEQSVGHIGKVGNNRKTHMGIWTLRPGD